MGSTTYGGLLSPPYTRALRLFALKIGRAELIEEIAQRTDSSKGEAQRYVSCSYPVPKISTSVPSRIRLWISWDCRMLQHR